MFHRPTDLHNLIWLSVGEDFIADCHHESFKVYTISLSITIELTSWVLEYFALQ